MSEARGAPLVIVSWSQPLVIEKMKLPLAHGIQARAMAHALPRRGAQSSVVQLQKRHSPSQERRSSSV